MANINPLHPGQKVRVIDPDDGYYLDEGEVAEVKGKDVYVRFAHDDTGQRFRAGQLQVIEDEPE